MGTRASGPGRWEGYWDENIKRNIARDDAQDQALRDAGWEVIRLWDFEIEESPEAAASRVAETLETRQIRTPDLSVP